MNSDFWVILTSKLFFDESSFSSSVTPRFEDNKKGSIHYTEGKRLGGVIGLTDDRKTGRTGPVPHVLLPPMFLPVSKPSRRIPWSSSTEALLKCVRQI